MTFWTTPINYIKISVLENIVKSLQNSEVLPQSKKVFKDMNVLISGGWKRMVQEIVITYETLFELLQREKERNDLQKMEDSFFTDTINYIKDKKKTLEGNGTSQFANEQRKNVERQIENTFKIIKELYERREKKIINLSLNKSRTKSKLIETSALLKEERVFFDSLTSFLDNYRDAILNNVLQEKIPFMQESENKTQIELKKSTKLVRFIHYVPKFVGPELEEYGPFDPENMANLPLAVADVLISKEKVEEVQGI